MNSSIVMPPAVLEQCCQSIFDKIGQAPPHGFEVDSISATIKLPASPIAFFGEEPEYPEPDKSMTKVRRRIAIKTGKSGAREMTSTTEGYAAISHRVSLAIRQFETKHPWAYIALGQPDCPYLFIYFDRKVCPDDTVRGYYYKCLACELTALTR